MKTQWRPLVQVLSSSVLAGLVMLAGIGPGRAQQGNADPAQEYHVTPAQGPWMICVTSYMGAAAPKLAQNLCLELRRDYHLQAFIFNRGAEERRQQQEQFEKERQQQLQELRKMGYVGDLPVRHRTVRVEEQFAVLVGGYADMEVAHRALNDIKKLKAPQSMPKDPFTSVGVDPSASGLKQVHFEATNPFLTSFVVRNPTVPAERPQTAPDPFLKQLNEYEPLSLLKCPKPWTLAVKEFHGNFQVQSEEATKSPSFLDSLMGKDKGTQLEASAQNAHNLAEALRKMGFEAYVLHTRYDSIVTVGGYERGDDPRMQEVQRTLFNRLQFKADASQGASNFSAQLQLLPQPVPIQVPRP
ncbi:MAG: hypothetical protein JO112_06885 [Planctomycetes bacterium]|nr:hypothetical protein [Planctomycetota bacterium]